MARFWASDILAGSVDPLLPAGDAGAWAAGLGVSFLMAFSLFWAGG